MPDALQALAREAAEAVGVRVFDVEFMGSTLQVFIEADQPVTIELCKQVSDQLSLRLDQANLIPSRYRLEVSSPGLERKLRGIEDFRREVGKFAHVVTARAVYDAVIRNVTDSAIVLAVTGSDGAECASCDVHGLILLVIRVSPSV